MNIGLIGYGNIGQALAGLITTTAGLAHISLSVLTRPGRRTNHSTVHDVTGLLATKPDLIIECAGHSAVAQSVPDCLAAGVDTVVASIGALADDALHQQLTRAARDSGARLILPAGAIGGIDLLSALRPSGITSVVYEGRKPPGAWKGSPAEQVCDLDGLRAAEVFFTGTARAAALAYPKNANVAATLALAGVGFDDTGVRLIADPAAPGNQHGYAVEAGGARYHIDITGRASPDNPKTSMATVYSLLREVRNRAAGATVI